MKLSNLCTPLAAFMALVLLPHKLLADEGERISRELAESAPEVSAENPRLGLGKFAALPFHVTASLRAGYDDNVNLNSVNEQGSPFVSPSLALTYNFGNARTRLSLSVSGSLTYYAERSANFNGGGNDSENYDTNGSLTFTITHRATPRLTLSANIYASYQSQPDFETFNRGGLGFSRQNQDYFYSTDKFLVGYAWTPKFQTLTSYTIGVVNYDSDLLSASEDRTEHTFGNEFRFLIWPTTTIVAEYRLGLVGYTDNSSRDSTSHFFLGGFDHSFNPRFLISTRAGIEVRDYDENAAFGASGESGRTSPYGEATLNYAINKSSAISWTNRYSLEEPDTAAAFSRTTFRSGLSLKCGLTQRIVGNLSIAYQHDENEGLFGIGDFAEDAVDANLSLRYLVNRTWAFDLGYLHTEVVSDSAFREFSRNRIYAGASLTF